MSLARGFDWPVLLQIALANGRLMPRQFWRMTPAEFAISMGLDLTSKPLNRARLRELESLYGGRGER